MKVKKQRGQILVLFMLSLVVLIAMVAWWSTAGGRTQTCDLWSPRRNGARMPELSSWKKVGVEKPAPTAR